MKRKWSSSKDKHEAGNNTHKTETVAQWLAKGNAIKRIPASEPIVKADSIKSSTGSGGAATIMTMDDADLYYGESKPKKAKKLPSTIDLSALPEALRKKYVDEVISASQEENEE